MKILKRILLGLGILIALLLIVALFMEKEYTVEREITINKPRQEVFDYIKYLKNQDNFSKWAMMDPAMKKEYAGTDGTVGFISKWDSEKKEVGKGEQKISGITEGVGIDMALHFIEPFDGLADAQLKTETISENQTKVKWNIHSEAPYPTNIIMLFMDMDKMLGDDLQTGLTNLKSVLEK